jgi:hypothetical protein
VAGIAPAVMAGRRVRLAVIDAPVLEPVDATSAADQGDPVHVAIAIEHRPAYPGEAREIARHLDPPVIDGCHPAIGKVAQSHSGHEQPHGVGVAPVDPTAMIRLVARASLCCHGVSRQQVCASAITRV